MFSGFLVLETPALAFEPWWPSPQQTKAELFSELEKKMGKKELPAYSEKSVLEWSAARFPAPKKRSGKKKVDEMSNQEFWDKNLAYIYENLLVAEEFWQKAQETSDAEALTQQQQLVLNLAHSAALCASLRLNDYSLVVQIREAYQLPYLSVAPSDATNVVSKERILENINSDYQRISATHKEIAALKALIELASNRNVADAARSKLAQAYAGTGDYERAIAYLQAIQDPSISGAKKLIPKYQALFAKQQAGKKLQ